MSVRGLILVPEFSVSPDGSLEIRNAGGPSMEAMVRERLPYWDQFDLPDNPILGYGLTPDLEFLRGEGIVQKSNARPANFSGSFAELWVRAQFEAWRMNEVRQPGQWSLAQQGNAFWAPEDERTHARSVEVVLYDALPAPGSSVPLQDILEFKSRRASELAALRAALDDVYLEVLKSHDVPRALTSAISRLESSLAAIEKVTSESWRSRLRSTIKVDLSFPTIAGLATAGAAVAPSLSLPLAVGAGVGAALAAIKFEFKQDSVLAKLPSGTSSLAYAIRVKHELAAG